MHKSGFLLNVEGAVLKKTSQLNLDSVLVASENISPQTVSQIKEKLGKAEIYASVVVFAGKDLLEKYPDARAVDSNGKDTTSNALIGVCPTHPGVRKDRLEEIKRVLESDIQGVWLNHMRYPTAWEKANPDILDTCYCQRCLKMFEEYIGEPIAGVGGEGTELQNIALHIDGSYYHEWLEFKAKQIVSFVEEAKALIAASGKDIKLGMFVVPWKDKDYGAGIQRVVAQDFTKLISIIDVFSPGLFHKMLGKDVGWIGEMVEYYWQLGKAFLPLTQSVNEGGEVSTGEFKQALQNATKSPSMGVCVYHLGDLVKQREKFEAFKAYTLSS